ncbi:hypothetical protein [Kingella oralis]|nr:hypothetical protein [Kingella oralis]
MLFEPLGCAVWDNEAASIVVGKPLAFLQTDTAFQAAYCHAPKAA